MFELIRANQQRSAFLVAGMALVLLTLGYAVGEALGAGVGPLGLFGGLVIWVVMSLTAYFQGGRLLLAISRARQIDKTDHPILFNVVEEMCVASGTPRVPDIWIIDDDAPNAFATGRDADHASVAVTSGLLKLLTRDELQGVIAHEIAHVRNRDVLYMTMVTVMLGSIVLLADIGRRSLFYGSRSRTGGRDSRRGGQAEAILLIVVVLVILFAPLIARLIYLAVSRKREYLADACGALYSRYPEGLASALEKLAGSTKKLQSATTATAALYIVNPLRVTARGLADLTSTHPPTSQRVRILRSMGGSPGFSTYEQAFKRVTGRAVGVIPLVELAAERRPAPPRTAGIGDPRTLLDRTREATDLLWHLQHYAFIACSCGTNLKVPPAFAGKKIECPHCSRMHAVPAVPAAEADEARTPVE
ncbi:MAG TPA: M48 family metallopeptidase [Thermoanaerobaculia bacterium]|nr:M48 family metallopeptidase [Thermoanaerobaculia bacterium]